MLLGEGLLGSASHTLCVNASNSTYKLSPGICWLGDSPGNPEVSEDTGFIHGQFYLSHTSGDQTSLSKEPISRHIFSDSLFCVYISLVGA